MPDHDGLDVIVVDDNCRLAIHLWHYLAGNPGFGIGDVSADDRSEPRFWRKGKPQCLSTPDGGFRVWWVEARGQAEDGGTGRPAKLVWRSGLKAVLKAVRAQAGTQLLHFLIDVRGPYKEHGPRHYSPRDVLAYVAKHVREKHCATTLVSSYRRSLPTGSGEESTIEPVLEKTPETFELIRQRGRRHPAADGASTAVTGPASPLHFLVTGAGFELRGKDLVRSLGHPATGDLLKRALRRVDLPTDWRARKDKFPVPVSYLEQKPRPKKLLEAAKKGDLDAYWNELLQLEAAKISAGGKPGDPLEVTLREHALRESFRDTLLEHDWGHLRQALDAVDLTFGVWLTTNYSGFVDRAIQLWTAHNPDEEQKRPWRVISTSNEAIRHLRQLLHGKDYAEGVDRKKQARYLFKLHGDIAHLTTMALAGHDKELYTPLSLPIDSLHMVYMTAEQHLLRLLHNAKEKPPVLWHVVGHGLQDRLLVRLMVRVISATDPTRHSVNVLEFDPGHKTFPPIKLDDPPPSSVLLDGFRTESKTPPRVVRTFGTAQDYVARLRASGFIERRRPRGEDGAALLRALAKAHHLRSEPVKGASRSKRQR